MPTDIRSSRLRSGSCRWNLELGFDIEQYPLRSGARSWSPALLCTANTWSSYLGYGSAYWVPELSVPVCELEYLELMLGARRREEGGRGKEKKRTKKTKIGEGNSDKIRPGSSLGPDLANVEKCIVFVVFLAKSHRTRPREHGAAPQGAVFKQSSHRWRRRKCSAHRVRAFVSTAFENGWQHRGLNYNPPFCPPSSLDSWFLSRPPKQYAGQIEVD